MIASDRTRFCLVDFEKFVFAGFDRFFEVVVVGGENIGNLRFQKAVVTIDPGGLGGRPGYQRRSKGPTKAISGLGFDFYGHTQFLQSKMRV